MSDRDEKGRFVPGHKLPGPGRPSRATERAYFNAMLEAVTPEDWNKATKAVFRLAKRGDVKAFLALVGYYAGLPERRLNISMQDATLLSDLLIVLDKQGIAASEVFEAMLRQVASMENSDNENE